MLCYHYLYFNISYLARVEEGGGGVELPYENVGGARRVVKGYKLIKESGLT